MNTWQKGQYARLKVELRAAEKGAIVSVPTTEVRYDLILDWCGKLYRVQIKYGDSWSTKCQGAVRVDLKRRGNLYTETEVDAILVYLPKVDKVCWFGPEIFHNKHALQIRMTPSKNGQKSGCFRLEDYVW